ncbi:MAG: ferredoxin reductase family protein [Patescibacteria group bacterium]
MIDKVRFFSVLFFPSVLTVILWLFSKVFVNQIFPQDFWQNLTQISALVGTVTFGSTMILSARWKWVERFFGGFDKAYVAHKYNGVASYILLFLHFLSIIIPKFLNFQIFINYVIPVSTIDINLGILSFYLLSILLLITFIKKVPYHFWKKTHEYMGVSFLLGFLHTLLIPSDVSRFLPLKIWMIFFASFSLFAFFWQRFFWPNFSKKYIYKISKIENFGDVIDIYLEPKKEKIDFYSGQYVFLKIEKFGNEFHPFTISSAPNENFLRFSIKKLGDWTKKLDFLKIYDEVEVYAPLGEFGDKFALQKKDMVFLAGGIGVAPFLSLIKTENKKQIHFFYSANNDSDAKRVDEILEIVQRNEKIDFEFIDTRVRKRISALEISKKIGGLENKYFFLCGSQKFMHGLLNDLIDLGVQNRNIILEDFNFKS